MDPWHRDSIKKPQKGRVARNKKDTAGGGFVCWSIDKGNGGWTGWDFEKRQCYWES